MERDYCIDCSYINSQECGYSDINTIAGHVRQHYSQSLAEMRDNRRIACYLAEKYGHRIDLIPRINNEPNVRNADSFNHTLGRKQEYKVNTANTYNSYDMSLREGRKQASSIVILLTDEADLSTLSHVMSNRCKFSKKYPIRDVMLIWRGKDAQYTNAEITSPRFKIRKEDFK